MKIFFTTLLLIAGLFVLKFAVSQEPDAPRSPSRVAVQELRTTNSRPLPEPTGLTLPGPAAPASPRAAQPAIARPAAVPPIAQSLMIPGPENSDFARAHSYLQHAALSKLHFYQSENPLNEAIGEYAKAESDEEKAEAEKKLKTKLEEDYDRYLEKDLKALEEMRARLERLESQLKKRQEAKDVLVDLKLDSIISEAGGIWPGGSPSPDSSSIYFPQNLTVAQGQNSFPARVRGGSPFAQAEGRNDPFSQTPSLNPFDESGTRPALRQAPPIGFRQTGSSLDPNAIGQSSTDTFFTSPNQRGLPGRHVVADPLAKDAFDELLTYYSSLLNEGEFATFIRVAMLPDVVDNELANRFEGNMGQLCSEVARESEEILKSIGYAIEHEATLQHRKAMWGSGNLSMEQTDDGRWCIVPPNSVDQPVEALDSGFDSPVPLESTEKGIGAGEAR